MSDYNGGEDSRPHRPVLDPQSLHDEFMQAPIPETWVKENADRVYESAARVILSVNKHPEYEALLQPYIQLLIAIGHRILVDPKLPRWQVLFELAAGITDESTPQGLSNTCKIFNILAMISSSLGDKELARVIYNALLDRASKTDDPRLILEIHVSLISISAYNEDHPISEDFKSHLLNFSRFRIGDPEITNRIYLALAKLAYEQGRFDRSVGWGHNIYNVYVRKHDHFEAGRTSMALGNAYRKQGQLVDAETYLDFATQWFKERDYIWFYVKAMYDLAQVKMQLGKHQEAEEIMKVAYFESSFLINGPIWMCAAHGYSIMLIQRGAYEEARPIINMVYVYHDTHNNVFEAASALHTAAYIEYKTGNFRISRLYVDKALDTAADRPEEMPATTNMFDLMWRVNNLSRRLNDRGISGI